ncbi:LemA family protein [Alloprevotella tannerae]|uniref:LemA family protein n=1 Tax=Alloprevotella tannerae TaxID=76122 RepID=A0A929X0G6_9BACT|nr:LemA family protein [Alloprevotella tannerae]MBF0970738.1 LemA family protein [Alloprevotella tannerae]
MKSLSKKNLILLAVGGLLLICVFWSFSTYNGLVGQDEVVTTAWGNVQTQYQRRSDLIPNLVNVVKGYAKHEKETLEAVVSARARATQITVSADGLTPEKLQQYQQAQGQLSAALGKLLAVSESYPNLKANENFSELQAQLEGTENRISESRTRYNKAVQGYNISVRKFPGNIVAKMFGFAPKAKFEAAENAQNAPTVNFE